MSRRCPERRPELWISKSVWEPLTKESSVPALPSHWRSEAIKANSECLDHVLERNSDLRSTLIFRGWVLDGSEDMKRAAGAGECGPGRRTTPSCRILKLPMCPNRPTASNKSSLGPEPSSWICGSRPVIKHCLSGVAKKRKLRQKIGLGQIEKLEIGPERYLNLNKEAWNWKVMKNIQSCRKCFVQQST